MWRKLGRVYEPPGAGWMSSHAQNPIPEHLGGDRYRVHFATRDERNRARGGYFTFSLVDPHTVEEISDAPTLDLGPLGAFDDAGVMPSALVDWGGERRLYYTGWSRTVDVPFAFHIGLAVDDGTGRFERRFLSPVIGRNPFDPFIVGAPCVLAEGHRLRMWYISATAWVREAEDAKPKHYYTVKTADSADGVSWSCSDHLCIPYGPDEYAIARPVVFRTPEGYTMWFTYRGGADTYRVGTARSADGVEWDRDEKPLGIDVSDDGWDSEMICYAHPLVHDGVTYALYNGNAYGATGIGLAVWDG